MDKKLTDIRLDQDNLDYISDVKQSLLVRKTQYVSMLLILMVAFLVTMIIWAHYAVLDEMTVGEGKIIPSSKVKKIQSLEGGLVEKVYVVDGQIVQAGQLLLRIDDTGFESTYREENSKYISILAKIARLKAEINDAGKITFPPEVNIYWDDLRKRETKHFESRQQVKHMTLEVLKHNHELSLRELKITEPLVKEGIMSRIELLRIQREVNQNKGELEERNEKFTEEAQAELNQAQEEAARLKEILVATKDRVERAVIRSPVNGTIKNMHISTIGEVIKPGQDIIEIVPIEDTLLVETQIKPSDRGFLRVGQQATVKVTAYDYSIYGGLIGKIISISPDTIQNEKGDHFFTVIVRTERNHLGKESAPLYISSGMTVSVHIITGEKSILEYILKPLLKTKQNAFRER